MWQIYGLPSTRNDDKIFWPATRLARDRAEYKNVGHAGLFIIASVRRTGESPEVWKLRLAPAAHVGHWWSRCRVGLPDDRWQFKTTRLHPSHSKFALFSILSLADRCYPTLRPGPTSLAFGQDISRSILCPPSYSLCIRPLSKNLILIGSLRPRCTSFIMGIRPLLFKAFIGQGWEMDGPWDVESNSACVCG